MEREKMNKKDIIKELAERIYGDASETNIKEATQFCDTLIDIFKDALIEGNKIVWKGFLTAEVVERGQRRGRHPQTNEVVTFPPSKTIKCKMSQSIKDIVNEK